MNPKPYKENKSSLRQFLEKKSYTQPVPKGSYITHTPINKWRDKLHKIYLEGTEEDKARLDAVGWTPYSINDREWDRFVYNKVDLMRSNDEWKIYNAGASWFFLGRAFGKTLSSTYSENHKYFVAGKGYTSRGEFLFSRTSLGRELC